MLSVRPTTTLRFVVPILNELKERALELSALPLSKPMNTGVTYLLGQWQKLLVPFTQDGRLEIDNGSAERRLRPVFWAQSLALRRL